MTLIKLILFSILAVSVLGVSQAYADVTISAVLGSGAPGCEETAEGCYIPSTATVDVGGKVIMSNPDTAAHTFTAGSPTDGPSGEFDSGLIMAGGLYEYSPDTVGEIPYFCMVHPWMLGSIIVTDDGNTTPTEPEPKPDQKDNPLEIENQKLKDEITDLKLENKQLKNKINTLNAEIDSLKDQIVSMTKEFVAALEQLNKWFIDQLNS